MLKAVALRIIIHDPLELNPLRDLLAQEVDFEAIRTRSPVRLLVSATRVQDGAVRVFRTKAISMEVVLASACLPRLHQAVEIHGEAHWDGGYAANPPVIPLVGASGASDVLLVQLIPTDHAGLPVTKAEIDKRLGQITFNSPLQKELEAIGLIAKGGTPGSQSSRYRLTERGESLRAVLTAVYQWGDRHAAAYGVKCDNPLRAAGRSPKK